MSYYRIMCDLKFTSELLEEMKRSHYSQHQSNMIKWLLRDDDDDDEQSTATSNRSYTVAMLSLSLLILQ